MPDWKNGSFGSIASPFVMVSNMLPFPMSPSAEAKAIVRHGFAAEYEDFEKWGMPEGTDIGAPPGTECHVYRDTNAIYVSDAMMEKLVDRIVFDNLANRPLPRIYVEGKNNG